MFAGLRTLVVSDSSGQAPKQVFIKSDVDHIKHFVLSHPRLEAMVILPWKVVWQKEGKRWKGYDASTKPDAVPRPWYARPS